MEKATEKTIEKKTTTESVMDTSSINRDTVSSLNHSMLSGSEEDPINSDKDMTTNRELSSDRSIVMVCASSFFSS